MPDWTPDLSRSERPRYLAIADTIATDIAAGRLSVGDRLPPQRTLAKQLGLDFTTVARGYVEAQKRGLIASRVGHGSFVLGAGKSGADRRREPPEPPRVMPVDLSMNLPPEPDDPALVARMQEGYAALTRDLIPLLRYQGFGGSTDDKDAAARWLARRRITPTHEHLFVTPGAHPALLGILGTVTRPGDVLVSECTTYPGVRSIAAQLGLKLVGVRMDREGIQPDLLEDICRRHAPKALYLNPTLQNPTTITMSAQRREKIVAIARQWRLQIVEDDAYGFIPTQAPPPIAALAPELTWHIAGLSKCLGAGLRVAYVVAPDARSGWACAAAVRAATVMASPLNLALATRWIQDGTADAMLQAIRTEAAARQALAAELLPRDRFLGDPLAFNIWLSLPEGWTRSAFIGQMRMTRVGVVGSDAFTVEGPPKEAVRVCLGGPASRDAIRSELEFIAHMLEEVPATTTLFP